MRAKTHKQQRSSSTDFWVHFFPLFWYDVRHLGWYLAVLSTALCPLCRVHLGHLGQKMPALLVSRESPARFPGFLASFVSRCVAVLVLFSSFFRVFLSISSILHGCRPGSMGPRTPNLLHILHFFHCRPPRTHAPGF